MASRRSGLAGSAGQPPVAPSGIADGGKTFDFLRAEHGFSALFEARVGGRVRRVLYDAGATPARTSLPTWNARSMFAHIKPVP